MTTKVTGPTLQSQDADCEGDIMDDRWRIVAVSRRADVSDMIDSTLRRRGMEVICCTTLAQAREAVQQRTPQLIFCEDRLTDGDYRDLLAPANGGSLARGVRVVVLPGSEAMLDPDFVWNALRRGAYAVLGLTPRDADIEWVATRAVREDAQRRAA